MIISTLTHLFDGIQVSSILSTMGVAIAIVTVFFYYCANALWRIYEEKIGGNRLYRSMNESPSNKRPPDLKDSKSNKKAIEENILHYANFKTSKLLASLKDARSTRRVDRAFSYKFQPGKSFVDRGYKADELDMDHVYIDFISFLWAHTVIAPFSYLLWLRLTTWLKIKTYLVKRNIMSAKPVDYEEIAGKLLLEQSQVIHYYGRRHPDGQDADIAGFFFTDFPYIDKDCKPQTAELFAVEVDLKTKKMVTAKFEDKDLTAKQAVILLWFNTIAAQHVKLHALANWGINTEREVKEIDPFFYRNSIVTAVYNYFGKTLFRTFIPSWEKEGLLSRGWDPNSLIACFNKGIESNIWQHSNIHELVPHSRFVNFIVKVRGIFATEFRKHKEKFPGVDCEAMFVGTILHSLDHTLSDWNLEDPLWLDVDDPEYGKMAELGRIVKMGFVQDVPGIYFHKRFKGSGHPFYEEVYEKAAKIDKKLADHMDTCIVK